MIHEKLHKAVVDAITECETRGLSEAEAAVVFAAALRCVCKEVSVAHKLIDLLPLQREYKPKQEAKP